MVERRKQGHVAQRHIQRRIIYAIVNHRGGVIGVQNVAERAQSNVVLQIEEPHMALVHHADANFAAAELRLTQLHGGTLPHRASRRIM